MGARKNPGYGIGVIDTRLSTETLAAKGSGVLESAYTEATPVPGHPENAEAGSAWRPQVVGAQSVSVRSKTIRGGFPGREARGASVAVRLESESTDVDWRSWDEPNLVTDFTAPADAWGAAATWAGMGAATNPRNGKIVVVVRKTTGEAETWIYDPRAETWTAGFAWGTNPGLDAPLAMAFDEDEGRFVLVSGNATNGNKNVLAYYSEDDGATFGVYARAVHNILTATSGTIRGIAPARGLDWLIFADDTQFASSDRGITWETIAGPLTGTLHVPVRTQSGWAVLYSDSGLKCRLLGSPRSSFEDAPEIVVDADDAEQIVACADFDGVLYAMVRGTNADAARGFVQVYKSTDGGASWSAYFDRTISTAGNTVYMDWRVLLPSCGSLFALGTSVGHADVVGTWHMMRFGGWSNVEQGNGNTDQSLNSTGLMRMGMSNGGGFPPSYVPWDFPQNAGWTRNVGAGTQSLDSGELGFALTCTNLQQDQYEPAGPALTSDWGAGQAIIKLDPAAPVVANSGFSLGTFLDNAVTRWQSAIWVGRDGLEFADVGGAVTRGTVPLDLTQWTHLRWFQRRGAGGAGAGGLTVWYRQQGGGTTKWTRIADDVPLTPAAGILAGSKCLWGHALGRGGGAYTGTLHVRFLGFVPDATWRHELDTPATMDDDYDVAVPGLAFGRPVPGRGSSYPIPDATSTDEDLAYLTAVGGPTRWGEQVSLPAAHVHGVEHIHPDESPKPRRRWRSTDTSEVRFVYDQAATSQRIWYGGAIALVAMQATPRTIELATDDGAGGVTVLGTLDKGWSGINYTLGGSNVVPRAGTATIDRYFREGELVGGYLVMSTAGTPVARRIVRQSAGYWTTDATVQRVRLAVEGIDGTEQPNGTGELVHHSGVLVVYPAAESPRRYARIKIAAGQITPEGYYDAGALAVARVVGVGVNPSWEWTATTQLSRQVVDLPDGGMQIRETGAPRTITQHGWTDGVHEVALRLLAADADYVGVQDGVAIGTEHDAASSVLGVIANQLRSGEVPALVFPRLPRTSGTTITDPSLFDYVHLLTDEWAVSNVIGSEDRNPVLRVDGLAWRSIR